jgi:hypothetical protein
LHGKFYETNLRESVKLLRQAAESDIPDALYDLAICFEEGRGVRKNLDKAANLYLRAALHGHKQSVYEVGRCYYYGIGVEKNRATARTWLDLAEELGIAR